MMMMELFKGGTDTVFKLIGWLDNKLGGGRQVFKYDWVLPKVTLNSAIMVCFVVSQ